MHPPGNIMKTVFGIKVMSNDSYEEFTRQGRKGRRTRRRRNERWPV